MKYLLRAQTRATPFGLFAGVCALHIGERSAVSLGADHHIYRRTEPEPGSSVAYTDGASGGRAVSGRTKVQINGLAVVRGGRLVVPGGSAVSGSGGEVSAEMRRPLAAVLARAREPILLGALVTAVRDDLGLDLGLDDDAHADTRVDTLLHGLIESTFLVAESEPPPGPGTPSVESHRAGAGAGAGVGGTSQASTRQVVDVRCDAAVSIPRPVADEAAAAAAALVRLASRAAAGRVQWSDYHRRFLDRFGLGAVVPLAELLHGGDGLGYPSGYQGSVLPRPPEPADDAPAVLVELAAAAIWERRRELVLSAADLDRINPATDVHPQPHTDLRVEVHARSTAALDDGRFRLTVLGASRAAGTVTGRFLDLLETHERDRLVQDYRALPTATAGARRVELCSVATSSGQAAICRAPAVLDDRVVVGAAMPGNLALSQIAVSADTAGLYLISLRDRVPIEPTLFSALELTAHAHPVLRFLAEIAAATCTPCSPFRWAGVLAGAPYLPRVRVGRSVLAPARWHLNADDDLRAWQRRWQVPGRVVLHEQDRRLGLDLDESSHQEVLRQAVARRGRVTLAEAPEPDAFGWIDGRPHELAITLAAHPPRHPRRPRLTSAVTSSRSHAAVPGTGRWLSIELPCRPGLQDDVLRDRLPEVLDDSRAWWFLRHTDPDPHLRVRIAVARPEDYGALLARMGRWAENLVAAGVLGGPRVQTYRPESGRFGDGEALDAVEDVFVCDSAAARAQLAAHDSSADRDALVAASMLDIAEALVPGNGTHWLIEHGPRSGPALDPAARAHTIALSATAGQVAAYAGGDAILAAWARRSTSLAAYRDTLAARDVCADVVLADLLHLHHSRIVGPSLDHERHCLRLARSAALSRRARQGGAG